MESNMYYDFIENASFATWKSDLWHNNPPPGLGLLTFGDTYTRYGAVFYRYHAILGDGSGQNRVLETHPYEYKQGFVCGIYENIIIPENAKFITGVGFLGDYPVEGDKLFRVFFDQTPETLGDFCDWVKILEFQKYYNGTVNYFNVSLFRG